MLSGPPIPSELAVGGPLSRRNHAAAVRLAEPLDARLQAMTTSTCRNRAPFGRPMIALTTKRNMGPVRHILAQRVVAGMMSVSQPVQVRIPVAATGPSSTPSEAPELGDSGVAGG